ncbi:predicted protein [Plenodomus lingam JN3]|uniref:Transcription initiation factor TFIID subunit 4 n=1 Tax=Leptosphaeria maculans (strain JN3 / isolate v23.1.3 / race Av1-4-5-6-7-8) TaxID=985895 RepID=E5A770_LEPMJ|nr:predicted protein [Plenodomus lingam JN3]CBX99465.1 predicted protein [Plenodomus lingam JN3]
MAYPNYNQQFPHQGQPQPQPQQQQIQQQPPQPQQHPLQPPQHQQQQQQHGQTQPHLQHQPPPLPPQVQVQTQNLNMAHTHAQPQRPFSPSPYQHSPTNMSPTMGSGIPPAKRQRLSPNPPSPAPYQSPFGAPTYPPSPYATSPQSTPYPTPSLPNSPAAMQPPPFHQPQPYQHPNAQPAAPQGSMPPPKVPYSKTGDTSELEKANARDLDVNNISDVLTGSGIDLRAEEDNLLLSYRSFNSQGTGTSGTPHGSFNWSQQGSHGAFQGTGQLSQPMTQEQHEAEFLRKHEQAARILNESAQQPLTDPFLQANVLRHRIAKRAYEHGITVNVDGLFDKIPDKTPRDVTRTALAAANGEQVVGLEAASLLNQNAPLVEILSLLSLAAEERVRTLVEDAFALSQGRQNTSHGLIPPNLVDIAVVDKNAEQKMAVPTNILRTPWEAPDSATSPTATANKGMSHVLTLIRTTLLTRPTRNTQCNPAPYTPHRTDEEYERERLRKRQKRAQGTGTGGGTPADTPIAPLPLPEPLTKKAQAAAKKQNQSDAVVFGKANETAQMAIGGRKKKYAWMSGGGGGGGGLGSGANTPKAATATANTAAGSGTATPAAPATDKALLAKKRTFGAAIEETDIGAKIQVRDFVHVLELDGREKKSLCLILARMKSTDKDEKKAELDRRLPSAAGTPGAPAAVS